MFPRLLIQIYVIKIGTQNSYRWEILCKKDWINKSSSVCDLMFHTIVNAVGKISKLLILQYTTSGKLSNMPNEVLNEQWIKLPRLDLTSNSVSLCE